MENNQNIYDLRAKSQIIRKDGKGVIFEVMDTSFNIEKVLFNFQKYDKDAPAGQKVQDRISMYMDFAQVLRLANDFALTGRGYQKMQAEKKQAEQGGGKYWGTQIAMGGTSTASLARQNRSRKDGKPEFRALSIMPSYKNNAIALSAVSGPGKVTSTGGYAPDGTPDSKVQLALSIDDWMEVLLITKAAIEAYLSYKYSTLYPKVQEERRQFSQQNRQTQAPVQTQQNIGYKPIETSFAHEDSMNDFIDGPMGVSSNDAGIPF